MTNTTYRYAIVGTGREQGTEGATGFGMAHPHMRAFSGTGRVDLVAVADPEEDRARHFVAKYEKPDARVFADCHALFAEAKPEIVSICTWPHLHADIAVAACEAGVRGVHCEKPMATTWGDAKRMKAAAKANGVVLTFNHQRRFLEPFQTVRQTLRDGVIGTLQRMEGTCSDMFDWGTHWVDMQFFYNEEIPAEWVIGQVDSRTEHRIFGAYAENQAICHVKYRNGVRGIIVTGFEADLGAAQRLIGSDGIIEIGWDSVVRVRAGGDADWRVIPTSESIHGEAAIPRAAEDLIRALDDPAHTPLLSVDNALQAIEVIMATFESSRRRGRVDLPLDQDDNALVSMFEANQIGPNRAGA